MGETKKSSTKKLVALFLAVVAVNIVLISYSRWSADHADKLTGDISGNDKAWNIWVDLRAKYGDTPATRKKWVEEASKLDFIEHVEVVGDNLSITVKQGDAMLYSLDTPKTNSILKSH